MKVMVFNVIEKYTSSYFTLRHSRSTNTLSRQLPLPSIDSRTPLPSTVSLSERVAGELATLIGIDDFRLPIPRERLFEHGDGMLGFKRDGYSVREHTAACPVDDCREIDEAARHRHVRLVECPDLIAAIDFPVAQQVRPYRCSDR